MQFRLISYNIHKGIGGVDRRYRLQRIIDTLADYDADIIFMQEVDEDVPRSRHHRQVIEIAEGLGLKHHAFQRNVKLKRGHYGNAVLSRHPLTDVENFDLTVTLKKRRRAQFATCQIRQNHQRTLHLVNFHLGLAGFERAIQIQKVLRHLESKSFHHDTPVIVAGDYNDVWGTIGKKYMQPAGFLAVNKNSPTFPAIIPVRQLDHIFYRGEISCSKSFVGHSDLARQASDHLPVIADFSLKTS